MTLRTFIMIVLGLAALVLVSACTGNQSAEVVVPTLAVLPASNSASTVEVTPVVPTRQSEVQSGVDQLFTQTAQAQQRIAPTETVVAAFNEALTATAQSVYSTQRSQLEATWSVYATASAEVYIPPAATFYIFPTLTNAPTLTPFPIFTLSRCLPPPGWTQYTIEGGDSIGALAEATGVTIQDIVNANCLSDPDTLFSGQVIYLPRSPISS